MNEQDEKFLNTFQFMLLVLLIVMALKSCNEDKRNVNIESCKPMGCTGE